MGMTIGIVVLLIIIIIGCVLTVNIELHSLSSVSHIDFFVDGDYDTSVQVGQTHRKQKIKPRSTNVVVSSTKYILITLHYIHFVLDPLAYHFHR